MHWGGFKLISSLSLLGYHDALSQAVADETPNAAEKRIRRRSPVRVYAYAYKCVCGENSGQIPGE